MQNLWIVVEHAAQGEPRVILQEVLLASTSTEFRVWRTSPVHPVDPENFSLPKSGKYYLGFLVHPCAFSAIGSLNAKDRRKVLYGVGLASIVVCSEDPADVTRLVTRWNDHLRASEIWTVQDGVRMERRLHLAGRADLPRQGFDLYSTGIVDPDVRWLALELGLNLRRFAELSAQYLPSNLPRCKTWHRALTNVLKEIKYIETIDRNTTPIPNSLSKEEISLLRSDTFFRKQKLNANIDRLIHVNSSLVYAASQAFHGSVPIDISLPLISQHSLLGVGTAWMGLRNLCTFIENAFRQYSVARVVLEQFPKLPWRSFIVDIGTPRLDFGKECLDANSQEPIRPKITFFSSRLGFGESDFTVTCATQALHAASSPRYTPLTISHELLHAHVKSILLSIFSTGGVNFDRVLFKDALGTCVGEYLAFEKSQRINELKLIHTLRFGLLRFVADYRIYSRKAKEISISKADVVLAKNVDDFAIRAPKTIEQWVTAFRGAYRFLEEIMVHTLDFHYFYAAQVELYVDSLWTSWEFVPSITDKLEWYVVRTRRTPAPRPASTTQRTAQFPKRARNSKTRLSPPKHFT